MPTGLSRSERSDSVPFLGVLGGMGPAAAADFLLRLAKLTPARRDQDHLPVIMYANPATPDRSNALMGTGPSPVEHLTEGIRFLDQCGVKLIAVPCNSAHAWYRDMQVASSVPVLHIADAAIGRVGQSLPDGGCVGLLATEGTLRLGFYQQRLEAAGYSAILPQSADDLDLVMHAIRSVKAGSLQAANALLWEAAQHLLGRGADRIIIACTDLSAALGASQRSGDERLVDAADALAQECIVSLLPARG